jgi:hypothetical protein
VDRQLKEERGTIIYKLDVLLLFLKDASAQHEGGNKQMERLRDT